MTTTTQLEGSALRKQAPGALPKLLPLNAPASQRRYPTALVAGAVIVLALALVAALAPQLAPYDMARISPADRLQPPSWEHLFGTDAFGRDLFSRVLYGARLSLAVAVLAVAIAALPGILLGVLAGMYTGFLESLLTRLMDAWIAVPSLLLAVVMAAALGRSTLVLALALGLVGISTYYRQARAETLLVRGALYVEAARALGCPELHTLRHHVLPNVLPSLLVLVSLRIGAMLLAVSALGFIGLGAPPPEPEWGALMAEGRDYLRQAWWLTFFPGLAIALTTFGLNLLGDGLRDALDPRHS